MKKATRITGLFTDLDKNGKPYLSATIPGTNISVKIFKNNFPDAKPPLHTMSFYIASLEEWDAGVATLRKVIAEALAADDFIDEKKDEGGDE